MPLYIFLFATTYYLMEHVNPATFAQPLTRIDSILLGDRLRRSASVT